MFRVFALSGITLFAAGLQAGTQISANSLAAANSEAVSAPSPPAKPSLLRLAASGVSFSGLSVSGPSPEQQAPTNRSLAQKAGPKSEPLEPGLVGKPRWELGLGVGYFSGFDYPASKDPNELSLVLPFFLYRSEMWRFAGRGGLGAVAVEKPRIKLDFSLGGSLNAESDGNSARESMPNLDFLFEVGPQLNVLVARKIHPLGGVMSVRWYNAARAVVSTDFSSADGRGVLLNSELQFSWRKVAYSRFDFQARLRARWASEDLHKYFYAVEPRFATTERPAYRARAGYLGSRLALGAGVRVNPRLRLFGGLTLEDYSGAANQQSPLYETDQSVGFALALVWTAFRSEQTISVFEED